MRVSRDPPLALLPPGVRYDHAVIDLSTIPELDPSEVTMLWVNDWYDGPIEAMVEHRGERCLMRVHDPEVIGTHAPWRWVLHRMTPERRADEERWHALFVENVGDHWDFTGEVHPDSSGRPERFYDAYRARPARDEAELEPIGWVADVPEPKARRRS